MFNALVTTVIVSRPLDRRSARWPRCRAMAVVVVPPLKTTTSPGRTSSAAARAIR